MEATLTAKVAVVLHVAGIAESVAVQHEARKFRADDPDGYRSEFVKLIELAETLTRQSSTK